MLGTNTFRVLGLIAFAAAAHGQTYWSTSSSLDCSILDESAIAITIPGGGTGYACYVGGTFAWLAAGGGWASAIRTAAPASNPVNVDYTFYDASGNPLTVDTTNGVGGTANPSNNELNFSLAANQPSEVDVLGATSGAPSYSSTTTGTAYGFFLCPDEYTCYNVAAQLVYSNLPTNPWSLSVPLAYDEGFNATWTQWSAEGIDDGGSHLISFVAYNDGSAATNVNIYVYNTAGTLVASGTTPVLAAPPVLSDGSIGEGGTYGALLKNVVSPPLPSGVFKVLFDAGAQDTVVQVFQYTGPSGTALQMAYDSAPTSTTVQARANRLRTLSLRRKAMKLSPIKAQ